MSRLPLPPFTVESAATEARAAEDACNSRDPERVSITCTACSEWRNRAEFVSAAPPPSSLSSGANGPANSNAA